MNTHRTEIRIPKNRRGHDRERFEQDVIVTNLMEEKTSFFGRLTDCSPCGVGLSLPVRLPKGTTLAVEWGDTMVLGQIIYSRQDCSQYRIGLRTDYIILDRTISRTDIPEDTPENRPEKKSRELLRSRMRILG